MREFGSEHPAIALPDGYFASLEGLGRKITYLRSGREALLLTAMAASAGRKDKIILLPAYCCWSMSAPFEKAGWKIFYYRLQEDLTIDIDYLQSLLVEYKPQAVLTMNFYGSASTDRAVKRVKVYDKRITVIEDFSHCTFSIKQMINADVDMYVSSIRKSIGICDGSIILSKEMMPTIYIQEGGIEFSDQRYEAQMEKLRYAWSCNQEAKQDFLSVIRSCEGIINEFTTVHPISERAKQMLLLVNGEEIAYARRQNMKHLISLLKGVVRMVPGIERSLDGAPFSLPILVENRDDVQIKLAKSGVYAPVLWPICEEAQQVCVISKMMGEQMLSIPMDQRYDWNDIENIAEIVKRCVSQ